MNYKSAIEDGVRGFCTAHSLDEECVNELSMIMSKVLGNIGKATTEKATTEKKASERVKCIGKNKKGESCRFYSVDGTEYCKTHAPTVSTPCNGMVDGRICDKKGNKVDGAKYNYCSRHKESWKLYEGSVPQSVPQSAPQSPILTQNVEDILERDSDYELFNGTDSDDELTFDQKVEMIANDMDIQEYKTSTKMYDEVKADTEKKLSKDDMEKWVTKNNLPAEVVKKATEKVRPPVTKSVKSASWVKKMQDKLKKNSDIMDMKNKKYAKDYEDGE